MAVVRYRAEMGRDRGSVFGERGLTRQALLAAGISLRHCQYSVCSAEDWACNTSIASEIPGGSLALSLQSSADSRRHHCITSSHNILHPQRPILPHNFNLQLLQIRNRRHSPFPLHRLTRRQRSKLQRRPIIKILRQTLRPLHRIRTHKRITRRSRINDLSLVGSHMTIFPGSGGVDETFRSKGNDHGVPNTEGEEVF